MKRNRIRSRIALMAILILKALYNKTPKKTANYHSIVTKDNKIFHQGEVATINGVPHLKLSGGYYEVGLQYGVLMREEINRLNKEVRGFFKLGVPWHLKPFTDFYLTLKLKTMEKRIPKRYREELMGIAQGAGISYNKLLLFPLFPEGLHMGCTSIIQRIEEGVILARNLDYIPFLGKYPLVVEYDIPGRQKIVSFGIIGFPGILTGFNENGLALSLNHVQISRKVKCQDIPIGYKNREILEVASSLRDVDDILIKPFQSGTGWEIAIVSNQDKNGSIYGIGTTGVKKQDLGEKTSLIVNNRFLDKDLRHENMGILTAGSFRNQGRYESTKEQLEKKKIRKSEDLIDLLASVQFYEYNDLELGLGHYTINNEQTIQSVILDLPKKEACFSTGKGYCGLNTYHKYKYDEGSIMVYKEEVGHLRKEMDAILIRRDKIFKLQMKKNRHQLLNYILSLSNPNIYEISEVTNLAKRLDNKKVLRLLEKSRLKFKNLPQPSINMGKVLIAEGRIPEGIGLLKEVLDFPYLYPADLVEVNMYLAETCHRIRDYSKSMKHARTCIGLIEKYYVGPKEQKIIDKMKQYMDK